ncbi:MAG: hypothetical protein LIP00_12625 [Parabacteroides sp.]|nr:hypothetical protein [Parabacteroides sp.]
MNKFILVFILLIGAGRLYPQKAITEANYLKEDSLLWMQYENKQEELSRIWEALPDKRDSIQRVFDEMSRKTFEKNIELAIKYALVPSGLQRLYMVRLDLPKDTLKSILDSLSPEMQESFYGETLRQHLQTGQIEAGDSIYAFPCVQTDGTSFDWSCTNGKQVLILYGGLGCMGKNGRDELELLYKQTSRNNLLVIVYWPCSSLKYLQQVKEEYPSDYIFVSDFKQDASPMKIKYGVQATPTCFLTDKQHIVKVKCTGLHMELFNPYLQRTGL